MINIQNVDHIRTRGVELAYQATDVAVHGVDLSGSVTYADSKIVENDNARQQRYQWNDLHRSD